MSNERIYFWESEQISIYMYPLKWWYYGILFNYVNIFERYVEPDWIFRDGHLVRGGLIRHYTLGLIGIDVKTMRIR